MPAAQSGGGVLTMVPEQPVCAYTATLDSSEPLVTRMLESETTEPCTMNGMELLSALMFRPSSPGFWCPASGSRCRACCRWLICTRPPAAPVFGSGVQFTAAEDAAPPVVPG